MRFQMLCGRPCTLINGICIFEGALIVTQFWMLVLTTDWQHIVTLVLLMFANYLLLAKLFKDKVSSLSFIAPRRDREPWQVSWIPRDGYKSVSRLEESSPHCQPYSVELADMLGRMFGMRQADETDAQELQERRGKVLSWLQSNHVDVKECDDGSLLIFGAARIRSPFTEDSCFCDNAIVLKRLRALIGKVPK
ncbi:unnamed protein product [Nippostrongylus brasiliensis]|uniref:Gemin6_C domain-containing protein n=1 Tax=Nippostrongylus brasiliensis TaxID=27835 RepID=A0A0N4YNC6_NIPBR|nr:unnamed protein product [Nippostrongylus brasiliensis]